MFTYRSVWGFSGNWLSTLCAVSVMSTGFACHFSCADIFGKELQKPTRKRVHKVMGGCLLVALAIYFLFTLCGWHYASKLQDFDFKGMTEVGSCVQGNQDNVFDALKHLRPLAGHAQPGQTTDAVIVTLGKMCIFLVLFSTFPLFLSAGRSTIHGMLFGAKEASTKQSMLESLGIMLLIWAIAIFVPQVGVLLAYAGAGPGMALVMILPGLMMMRLNKHLPSAHPARLMPLMVFIGGIVLSVGGIAATAVHSTEYNKGANVALSSALSTYPGGLPTVKIASSLEAGTASFTQRGDDTFLGSDEKQQISWYFLKNSKLEAVAVSAQEKANLYDIVARRHALLKDKKAADKEFLREEAIKFLSAANKSAGEDEQKAFIEKYGLEDS